MGELKVLVLGDGLLGSEIVSQTGWDFISRKKDGFNINSDIEEFGIPNYDVVINCIANTDTYSDNKESHWNVNYSFVSHLIEESNFFKFKLVHISSDYIYAGSDSNANEDTTVPVHCNNWYGYTKLLADGLVQLQCENHLICRCTHKPNPFPYPKAWVDQVGNFDYVDIIAGLIIELIENNAEGVFNVGTEVKTIHELAMKTNPNVGKILAPNEAPNNQTMDLSKLNEYVKR
jgi:dTDP-4-dehydrorhamnose reductase